jgi:hypothetical protein
MEYLTVVFLHVAFGIFWAGSVIAAGFFFIPSILEAGPAGGAVMAGLLRHKLPVAMSAAAGIVLLTGIRLYMVRFTAAWVTTPEGLVLTLGALLAIGAFVLGIAVQKPTAQRLGQLGAQIAASGAPPTPAQADELKQLRGKAARIGRMLAWMLLGAALLMASHRLAVAF